MCLEYFRHFITGHKTVWCPSKTIEDGVFLCFFSVDLSRRKAVLLRGGPLWKGLGGIITYTSTPFAPPFLWLFGAPPFFSSMQLVLVAELGHAVVLLPGAVVPQALAVVPDPGAVLLRKPMIVPLLRSCSTVAPRPSAAAQR